MKNQRHLPHALLAEKALLGSMLKSINCVNLCVEQLLGTEFFVSQHFVIFNAIKNLYKRNSQVDEVLIYEELKSTSLLQNAGGIEYIMELANFSEPFSHMERYLQIVKDKHKLRKIIEIAREAQTQAFDEPDDVIFTLDNIQKCFHELSRDSSQTFKQVGEILSGVKAEDKKSFIEWVEEMQERVASGLSNEKLLSGITTGYIDLDKIIDGLGDSHLIVLAARPGMGKTTFAINLFMNCVFSGEIPAAFFSLEMSAEQITRKLVFAHAEMSEEDVKKSRISAYQFQRLVEANGLLSQKCILIEDPPKISIFQLKSRARRLKEVYGIKLLVIDYLQLIVTDQKFPNRQEEVALISKELKSLARELNIPVLCLAQLSREVEKRESKKPVLSDLRESGAIEQDSDVIMFINRPDYHDPLNKPGLAEIIVGKNRHGKVGTATLAFKASQGKFLDCCLPRVSEQYEDEPANPEDFIYGKG